MYAILMVQVQGISEFTEKLAQSESTIERLSSREAVLQRENEI